MKFYSKIVTLLLIGSCNLSLLSGCQNTTSSILNEQTIASTVEESTTEESTEPISIGSFTTTDIYGETITQDIFNDYTLTMVNVFATWCGPCVSEIPALEMLYKEMLQSNVNVIGIVLDGVDSYGNPLQSKIETAKKLAEKTGATYPFILPDKTLLTGRLSEVTAVPETFFVDQNGNIVGQTRVGSRNYNQWKAAVKLELANLKASQEGETK